MGTRATTQHAGPQRAPTRPGAGSRHRLGAAMSVRSQTYFWVVCDRCRSALTRTGTLSPGHEMALYHSRIDALNAAMEYGWHLNGDGGFVCPGCATPLLQPPPPEAPMAVAQ